MPDPPARTRTLADLDDPRALTRSTPRALRTLNLN
jgi:hypothetical protein